MKINRFWQPGPLPLVCTTIAMQLVVAWLLGSVAATFPRSGLILAGAAVSAAIGLNLCRFAVWGYTHRRYPLSHTYPLTALFFPCVLALSWLHGDVLGSRQLIGTLLITLGALALGTGARADLDNDQ